MPVDAMTFYQYFLRMQCYGIALLTPGLPRAFFFFPGLYTTPALNYAQKRECMPSACAGFTDSPL